MSDKLLAQIHRVVITLPRLTLEFIAEILFSFPDAPPQRIAKSILNQLSNPKFRHTVQEMLIVWEQEFSHWSSQALGSALAAMAYSHSLNRQAFEVELVWTGPPCGQIPVRRTDQVLLQLIEDAQQEITLISFAVYQIPTIVEALQKAIERGINVRIIAETPEMSGKIPFGIATTFSSEIREQMDIYVWLREKRPQDSQGRVGSLHIKGAIADGKHLLITSANLTEYALTLNMEMGLLAHNRNLASQVNQIFDRLIQQETLVQISI